MAKEPKAERSSHKEELLSTYIARIEKALKKVQHRHVILSTDLPNYVLGRGKTKRVPILWPLYEHSMFYITTLKAGTRVRTHQHAENVFRYVIDGEIDITVRKKTYSVKKGMWASGWPRCRRGAGLGLGDSKEGCDTETPEKGPTGVLRHRTPV